MSSEYMSTLKADSPFPAFLEGIFMPDRFSYWLRTHRERLGLSCQEMSLCSGLDANTWGALENCEILEPSWSVASRVAAVLETDTVIVMFTAMLSAGARRHGLR